jgi:hypothetical protein
MVTLRGKIINMNRLNPGIRHIDAAVPICGHGIRTKHVWYFTFAKQKFDDPAKPVPLGPHVFRFGKTGQIRDDGRVGR